MDSSSSGGYYSLLDPDPPNKRKKSSDKFSLNNCYDFPKLGEKPQTKKECPKFIVIKSKIQEKPLQCYNIFLVSKALEAISSEPPQKINFTKDGNLLILTKNETQANRFLKASQLPGLCAIECFLHPSLNVIKGVVFAPALRDLSEQEIKDGLKNQGVVDCRKITRFQDGMVQNTPLHILHFNHYSLPKDIKIGFLICKIDPYIPSPMQCKNCFKLGHTKKFCKNNQICEVCSSSIHDPIPCKKIQCVNCNHPHRANNKKCPVYIHRQNILKYKTVNKCTFKEASSKSPTLESIDIPSENLDSAIIERKKKLNLQNTNNQSISPSIPNDQSINKITTASSTPTVKKTNYTTVTQPISSSNIVTTKYSTSLHNKTTISMNPSDSKKSNSSYEKIKDSIPIQPKTYTKDSYVTNNTDTDEEIFSDLTASPLGKITQDLISKNNYYLPSSEKMANSDD